MKQISNNLYLQPFQKKENKEQPTVTVSRSHPGKVEALAKEAFGPKTVITPAAGAGYKIMAVANGTYDLYLHNTVIKKWDICAGDAIIKTIDGKMTTTTGQIIDYSSESNVKITDGILVTLYDHDYYLSKLKKVIEAVAPWSEIENIELKSVGVC